MKKFAGNLPLIMSLLIMSVFSVDAPVLRSVKTETMYGVWVAVLIPAAIALMIIQIMLWVWWPSTRPLPRRK